jgi:hypothetical protein
MIFGLMDKSLWEYVDPDPSTGNTTVTNENVDSFRKAQAALILHLEDNQIIHIISLDWHGSMGSTGGHPSHARYVQQTEYKGNVQQIQLRIDQNEGTSD